MTRASLALLALIVACQPGRRPDDTSFPADTDASIDAGSVADASTDGGAVVDAGELDAGDVVDSGQQTDAGPQIACNTIFDCPVTDAGVAWDCFQSWCVPPPSVDAGDVVDSGQQIDAGVIDAGVIDAGICSVVGPGWDGCPNCQTDADCSSLRGYTGDGGCSCAYDGMCYWSNYFCLR